MIPPMKSLKIAAAAALLLAVSACGGSAKASAPKASSPPPISVTGMLVRDAPAASVLTDQSSSVVELGQSCELGTADSDLPGARIVIADDAGKTLGIGAMSQATFVTLPRKDRAPGVEGPQNGTCSMTFSVAGVTAGLRFYTVTVGKRGSIKVTGAELAKPLVLDPQ